MGFFDWITSKTKKDKRNQLIALYSNVKNEKIKNAIIRLNDPDISFEQYTNYVWYKADSDLLMWFYTQGIHGDGPRIVVENAYRLNDKDYFWKLAGKEDGIKRTHSGLPRAMVKILARCLGTPVQKVYGENKHEDNFSRTNLLDDILIRNNFKATLTKQVGMTLALGDGAYFVNINKAKSDFPIIEFYDSKNVTFEFLGDQITGVIGVKDYVYKGNEYKCLEKRSTIRERQEDGSYKTFATIEYTLFEITSKDGWKEVSLNTIPETEGLENVKLNNLDEMLCVPVMWEQDEDTNRGTSIFKGKIDLFDDFDQNISQEANIMRAITPVEYVDSNLLDRDKDNNIIKPNTFGKQFLVYKGAQNYNQTVPSKIESQFYDIDFSKLSVESLETLNRCLSGIISPATMGLELARNSTDLSQREKEKVTLQTLKQLTDVQTECLTKLYNLVLKVHDLMKNENAIPQENNVYVKFPEYANPTMDSKMNYLVPALAQGCISPEKFVDEVYGDNISKEAKEKEIEYITNKQNISPLSDDPFQVNEM